MSNEILGLINLVEDKDNLDELTYFRNAAAIPFMGRYRIIDFKISNFWYSGVNVIGVFANNKFRSLLDHLNREEDFGMEGRKSRIFVLPPDWNDPTDISHGDLKYYHNHMDLFTRSSSEHVIISDLTYITNDDYRKAFLHHKETGADITLIGEVHDNPPSGSSLRMSTSKDRVTDLNYDMSNPHVYTGVFIIKKDVLIEIVRFCVSNFKESLFHQGIRERLKEYYVSHYNMTSTSFYFGTVERYFKNSMKLLDKETYREFLYGKNRVMTKNSTRPSTLYKEQSKAKNSVLSNGVVVRGTVENSVLSLNVVIEAGATVKNAVIFANSVVKHGAYLENVIIDKDVVVSENRQLIGTESKPFIAAKRTHI